MLFPLPRHSVVRHRASWSATAGFAIHLAGVGGRRDRWRRGDNAEEAAKHNRSDENRYRRSHFAISHLKAGAASCGPCFLKLRILARWRTRRKRSPNGGGLSRSCKVRMILLAFG